MSSHTAETALKLIGKLILDGDLVCETGLHIGAGKGSLEIGGADNPVVKDAYGRPYIPGSSLRGRLRSLLEQAHGLVSPAELVYLSRRRGQEVRIHQSDRPDDEICLLFGRNPGRMDRVSGDTLESSTATPARLTVYDAPLDRDSITAAMRENLDDELTEVKSENAIDRITAQANPRTLERVPAGARFRVRIVMDVLCPEDKELRTPAGGGVAPARRRHTRRRRLARQRARSPGQSQAGVARPFVLLRRGRRNGPGFRRRCDGVAGDHPRRWVRGQVDGVIMTSGFLVRLRPAGPWRIGPDTGARHQVDRIYHSDTLYSALCRAFEQLGLLDAWLADTALPGVAPAVRFSSLFPFLRDTHFVPPPRNLWPPEASSKVNWRGARFVPALVVQSLLAKRPLKEEDWSVDGASACLLAARRNVPLEGPFHITERNLAAVDRLTGECMPHSAAVLEFHPGGGLWFAAGFANDAARDKWGARVKSAVRLLADSGFGGGRSRGWGRAGDPDFVDGDLESLILPPATARKPGQPEQAEAQPDQSAAADDEPVQDREIPDEGDRSPEPPEPEPALAAEETAEPAAEPVTAAEVTEGPAVELTTVAEEVAEPAVEPETAAEAAEEPAVELATAAETAQEPAVEPAAVAEEIAEPVVEPVTEAEQAAEPAAEPEAEEVPAEPAAEARVVTPPATAAFAVVQKQEPEAPVMVWWLLSLFSPAETDVVDWSKGNYSLATRGGRIESAARWGDNKLSVRMVEEGSVLFSPSAPHGTVRDVAPPAFPHPVYRSGFALSIPIPWRVIP